jgi:uncharacterized protein with PIN domain
MASLTPTKYAIKCDDCGKVYLTQEEYNYQMSRPNRTWICPKCGGFDAYWDDDNYESFSNIDEQRN